MQELDCIAGTFRAMAWHVGKHVAANPSGFNWRLENDAVDIALSALKREGSTTMQGPRQLVTIHNMANRTVINAQDTAFPQHLCTATLSAVGRDQFVAILEHAAAQPDAPGEG